MIAGEIGIADRFGHYAVCCDASGPGQTVITSGIVNSGEFWFGPAIRYESLVLFDALRVIPGITVGFSATTNSIGKERQRELTTLAESLGVEAAELDGALSEHRVTHTAVETEAKRLNAELLSLRERIAADIRAAAADPAFVARMAATGQVVDVRAPAEFAEAIEQQRAKLTTVAQVLDIKLKQ